MAMSLGESGLKQALSWIVSRLADEPGARRSALVEEAARRFDLSPLDTEALYRMLVEATRPGAPPGTGGERPS
jgi:hypothetical protein